MKVLVTGGAGYIGSHTVKELHEFGYNVLIYDNLSRGHKQAVKDYYLIEGNTAEVEKLKQVLIEHKVDAVMHFAAHSLVGESVEKPDVYYQNNVVGGLLLLEAVIKAGIKYFIFSSTAAVYGESDTVPIKENQYLQPTNPYGETKLILENALKYYDNAYGLKSISLRYFNAAGASLEGGIGEDHKPETHLIPIVLQAALGQREKVTVFGDDYPTPDGSAVRDYIHISDLSKAHLLALQALVDGGTTNVYNLGNGNGYSVLEVIKAAEKVVGNSIPYEIGPRRDGDPAVLVASSEKAIRELNWKPELGSLETIIETAWSWHKNNPRGFEI